MKLLDFMWAKNLDLRVSINNQGGWCVGFLYNLDAVDCWDNPVCCGFMGHGDTIDGAIKDYLQKIRENGARQLYCWFDKRLIDLPFSLEYDEGTEGKV